MAEPGRNSALRVNIDFNSVAEFYDLYVNTTFDVPFWLDVARACEGPRLELMCGTGRITLRLLQAGIAVDGLDYSAGLLARFRGKLTPGLPPCRLHHADARRFSLPDRYGLIFIGFHSIAEVLDDADKRRVFECARAHLAPGGRFWLSAQNPAVRARTLDGRQVDLGRFALPATGEELAVSGRYLYDAATGIAEGTQRYVCTRDGRVTREMALPLRFHLATPERLDELLESAGLRVVTRYGDYARVPFDAATSGFYLVEAVPAAE